MSLSPAEMEAEIRTLRAQRDAALQRAEEAERSDRANAEDAITQAARADAAEAKLRRVEELAEEWEELPSGFPPGHIMEPFAQSAARDLRASLSSTPDKKEPTP